MPAGYNMNDRQLRAIVHVKKTGAIANSEYQQLMGVAKHTAHRDLSDLVEKDLFVEIGARGKGAHYKLLSVPV